jgi:hypothetical protein
VGKPGDLSGPPTEVILIRPKRKRRRSAATDFDRSDLIDKPDLSGSDDGDDDSGGLASIGLADDDYEEFGPVRRVDRSDRSYGDRVEGWVRPEYQEAADEPTPGEYWTPIPVDLDPDPEPSAKGYGWPRPVERLPAVPDYEPATGFDLPRVPSDPTELVPVWPPVNEERRSRLRMPWAQRNEKQKQRNEKPDPDDQSSRRRPRPRPRPADAPGENSTVYVSRHAAEPPR